jgi:methyltransferase (TIGR00027 family)
MSESSADPVQARSAQNAPSETAMAAAMLRALAAHDDREAVRGADEMAELFLTEDRKSLLRDSATRTWLLKNKIAPGAYEFMIVRTAFFDGIVRRALERRVPQLVFLGAGYDTRPYRFASLAAQTKIFELDSAPTQERKKDILKKESIVQPPSIAFVPIDFVADDLTRILRNAGLAADRRSLFVWEGVTYYLSAEAVDNTLHAVRSVSEAGSSIAFDYASLSPEAFRENGVKVLRAHMATNHPGEPAHFGIPRGQIEAFLEARGYYLIEHLDAAEMTTRYLTLNDGSVLGTPTALFAYAHAETRP